MARDGARSQKTPAPNNLRPPPTRFIGRQGELATLERLLEEHRLVTVLGPPGVGKTRIALECALRRLGGHEAESGAATAGGVWVCDLTEVVVDVEGLCAALGRALAAPLTAQTVTRLGELLASRGRLLLILDNFEQLVTSAARALGVWRDAAPEARFLVTSRERLRLAGEVLFDLAPLSLPAAAQGEEGSEAVALFLDRARLVQAGYAPTAQDLTRISDLVRELDGLPLAIELAAARVRVLSPAGILANLDQRFRLLSRPEDGEAARQATLARAIDFSWGLLSPWEQAALAQSTAFRGGFDAEAAGAVLDFSAHPEAPWAVDVLQALCDKSLLYRYRPQELPEELRFSSYASIREYAQGKLAAADREAAQARHARYFQEAGRGWGRRIDLPDGDEALRRLGQERENLLAAHRFALSRRPRSAESAATALETALALDPLLGRQGPMGLRRSLLEAALLAAEGQAVAPGLRVGALRCLGFTLLVVGSVAEALRAFERALALAEEAADRPIVARIQGNIASGLYLSNQFAAAEAAFLRALELQHQESDPRLEAMTAGNLANLLQAQGRFEEARERYEQSLRLLRRVGDPRAEGLTFGNLGAFELKLGQLPAARASLEEARRLLEQSGDRRAIGVTLSNLGCLEQEQANLEKARGYFEQAVRATREFGARVNEGVIVRQLGSCLLESEEPAGARRSYEAALAIFSGLGDPLQEGLTLSFLGVLEAVAGDLARAAAHLDAAEKLRTDAQIPSRVVGLLGRGLVEVGQSREAARAGDWEAAASRLEAARRCLDAAQRAGAGRSVEARFAARLLTRALKPPEPRRGERLDAGPESAAPKPAALVIDAQGRWFLLPSGERVPIQKRRHLRLLLQRLAAYRLEKPGIALPVEALRECAWPNERLHPELGRRRVHTALWALRKLGLRELLQRLGEGYLLDPDVPLVHEGAPPSGGRG